MNTIRRKISIGFIAVLIVLLCAVIINIFELNRLRSSTEAAIEESTQSTEYASRMLNALQTQNRSVLNMVLLEQSIASSEYHNGVYELNAALLEAMENNPDSPYLKAIYDANSHYHSIIEHHSPNLIGQEEERWFMDSYVKSYYALDSAIKSYMTSPRSSVALRVSKLENDVYKTITPSVLTLIIAVSILLLFYFFIDTYYTKPVRQISRSLDNYMKNRIPYQMKIEAEGELAQLNENIAELISQNKKQQ